MTQSTRAHVARKRFGQHFLVDQEILRRIVSALALQPDDRVVEIGPGLAALTEVLLRGVERLQAVELDRDLVARLRHRFAPDRLIVHQADALTFDFLSLLPDAALKLRIVGNLPYNVASPLLVRLIAIAERVRDQHFMLQKEVVDRLVAGPGVPAYGRFGILLQSRYEIEWLFDVGPQAFDPPPRVDSAVFRMRPLLASRVRSLPALETLLAAGFAQRRKMLRTTLLPWLAARSVSAPELMGTERAEELPQALWYQLADRLAQAAGGPSVLG